MNMKRTGVVAGASLAAVAGLAAVLSSAGLLETDDAAKAGSSALSLYGVATVVHTGADGAVLDTQTAHNRLLDDGEEFILEQVFSDGETLVTDDVQIGAICLSSEDMNLLGNPDSGTNNLEGTLTAATFESGHDNDYATANGVDETATLECITDDDVTMSGSIATVGPLTFNASTTGASNWVPGEDVNTIGVCQADSGDAPVTACAGTLFAAVDINEVVLNDGETLTVTYTFNMASLEN